MVGCIADVLAKCTSLVHLSICSCMFFNNLELQKCANLHTVSLKHCMNPGATTWVLEIASNVKYLVLHRCRLTGQPVKQMSPSVLRLAINNSSLGDEDLIHVAQHCPLITHLSLDSVDSLTDAGVVYAAEHMTNVTSVDLSYTSLGNASLWALAQHRAYNLTELYLVQSYHISMIVVNYALKKCVHLLSFGVHCGDKEGEELDFTLLTKSRVWY